MTERVVRVFVEHWQQECCGKDFAVGNEVRWEVEAAREEALLAVGADVVEDHHDMAEGPTHEVEGIVRRIDVLDRGMVVDLELPQVLAGERWELELPLGVRGAGSAASGPLGRARAPVAISVTTHPREAETLKAAMRRLHGEAGGELEIEGADAARRGEAVVAGERVVRVVAAVRDAFVELVVRAPQDADVREEVTRVVRALRLTG